MTKKKQIERGWSYPFHECVPDGIGENVVSVPRKYLGGEIGATTWLKKSQNEPVW